MLFFKKKHDFCPVIYKQFNQDLIQLSEKDLLDHFLSHQHEKRIYKKVSSDVELMSMKWLRGNGLEIGPGIHPTPLFGNASAIYADCDESLAFGGSGYDLLKPLDSLDFAAEQESAYDFVVASHVLEHCDSFIRALENLLLISKDGGCIYIVLPNILFLNDINFINNFDFEHHKQEYDEPLKYANSHDYAYINASLDGVGEDNPHAKISDDYIDALKSGKIPQSMRFMSHEHNYDLEGWLDLIINSKEFLSKKFQIVDMRYGHLRNDCHFILEKKS